MGFGLCPACIKAVPWRGIQSFEIVMTVSSGLSSPLACGLSSGLTAHENSVLWPRESLLCFTFYFIMYVYPWLNPLEDLPQWFHKTSRNWSYSAADGKSHVAASFVTITHTVHQRERMPSLTLCSLWANWLWYHLVQFIGDFLKDSVWSSVHPSPQHVCPVRVSQSDRMFGTPAVDFVFSVPELFTQWIKTN